MDSFKFKKYNCQADTLISEGCGGVFKFEHDTMIPVTLLALLGCVMGLRTDIGVKHQLKSLSETEQAEALNFNSCGIKVMEDRKNKFFVFSLKDKKKQWLVMYDNNPKGDVYVPGTDGYFHKNAREVNPMNCLGSDEFSGGHIHMSDFDTKRWGIP